MKKVVFYGTTITEKELEVIEQIWTEADAKKKAQLILSLSPIGLDYAIHSFSRKNALFSLEKDYIRGFNLYSLPLLFVISYKRECKLTDDSFTPHHLSPEQWDACSWLCSVFNCGPRVYYNTSLLKLQDVNGFLNKDAIDFLCGEALFTTPDTVTLRVQLPEDNQKSGFFSTLPVQMSTLVCETLLVLTNIALLLGQQVSA